MKRILCFGDSNTWGLIPKTTQRYSCDVRWTGILQKRLAKHQVQVIEEGLCGRTTVFEDEYRENRNGLKALPEILKTMHPIDSAIIMLGTNDCKSCYNSNPSIIAKGVGLCIDELLKYIPSENILLVSPIYLGDTVWQEAYDPEFNQNSVTISHQLYAEYKKVAEEKKVTVLNAAEYIQPSEIDQEHFTPEGHQKLADVIYDFVINSMCL